MRRAGLRPGCTAAVMSSSKAVKQLSCAPTNWPFTKILLSLCTVSKRNLIRWPRQSAGTVNSRQYAAAVLVGTVKPCITHSPGTSMAFQPRVASGETVAKLVGAMGLNFQLPLSEISGVRTPAKAAGRGDKPKAAGYCLKNQLVSNG